MYRKPQSSYRYKVGGTLGVSDPSYIKRQADTDLYQSLKNGEYCYILNSRQMGKSSLKVRTIKKLQQEENFICANIDLSSIGKTLTERQWYESIVFNLRMQFDNYGEFNWDHKSINYESLPAIALFNQFVAQVLDYIDNNIVIFIDEIDIILSLKDFTDDLFLSIREYYNRRGCDEKYKNLTFCFLGVIDRSDLIKSQEITSFNVGESIDLQGFTLEEAQPFTIGLSDTLTQQQKQDILEQILQWTGGQPFLTQKILSLIVEKLDGNNLNVEEFIKQNILENWHYQDKLLHLKTIESRLLYDEEVVARLLGIYKKILELKEVETDTSLKIEESKLILSGLDIQQGNKLKIKCKIYEYIFNLDWVNKELDKVRPYESNRVNLWLKNNQDKSQLLTDSELQKALNWSVKQNVSIEDHQFISASQKLANTKKIFKTITLVFIGCLIFIVTISIFSLLQVNRKNRNLEIANSQLEIEKSQLEFQSGQEIKALKLIMQTAQIFKKSKSIYLEENVNDLVLNLGQILLNTTEKNYLEVDEGNNNKISSVNFNPQGTILATGLDNGDIKLWNTQGGILKTLKSHTKRVYNVKFNEDGSLLGSVSEDGDIKLWSLDDSEPITLHFSKAKKAIYSISFRDRKIVASSRDGLVGLWESPEDQTPAIFQASTNEIYDVNLSKDGKIVTASKDGLVQLWDSPEDKEPETLIDNKEAIYSLSWSSDDQTLAASSRNGTVTLYNMTDGSKKTITAHSKEVYDVVFSSNNLMATASEDEQIKLWDLTGKEVKAIKVNRGAVHNVNFSPDGQMLAAVSTDGKVNIWSLKKDTDFQSGIKVASFSSDGKWLAFGTKQGKVSLVDLTSTELKTKNLVTTCLITKELIATENIQDSVTKNAL
ncbi:MAG: AAA-like domain-containing protein [Xenococcus sp. (in: cyanobacteria)]